MDAVNQANQEDRALKRMIDSIMKMIERKNVNCDKTFLSIVKKVNSDGTYIVIDSTGVDRRVKCSLPDITISTGQNVWVKLPNGKLNQMHICGLLNDIPVNCDKTFASTVKTVNDGGTYIIVDNVGINRTVKCSLPDVALEAGNGVWVKIPCGNLNQMHICGVR